MGKFSCVAIEYITSVISVKIVKSYNMSPIREEVSFVASVT